jgi:hypothetical protein
LALSAALGLALMACTPQQQAAAPSAMSSPQDLAYCAELSRLYQRYVGPEPNSLNRSGVTPNVAGGEAVARCREGDATAAIPTLERLLTNADITLPPRAS